MAEFSKTLHGTRADLVKDDNGQIILTFFDPAWVRSDIILIDSQNLSLHAVLHEGTHFLGHIDKALLAELDGIEEITLSAPHVAGHTVSLRSPFGLLN